MNSTPDASTSLPHSPSGRGLRRLGLFVVASAMSVMQTNPAAAQEPTGTRIESIQQAQLIGTSLATLFTRCRLNGDVLDIDSLRRARTDFKNATIFAGTHGEGEDPINAQGRIVSWATLAEWLGLQKWFNDYIANQTRVIAKRYGETSGAQATVSVPPCMREVTTSLHQGSVRKAFYDPKSGFWFYQVKRGDTRSAIQRDFGLSDEQFRDFNPRLPWDPNVIHADFKVRVK